MTDGGEDGKTLEVKYGPPSATAIVREQFKHVKHAIVQNYIAYSGVLKESNEIYQRWWGDPRVLTHFTCIL